MRINDNGTDREMTAAELVAHQQKAAALLGEAKAEADAVETRAAAKTSARNKLAALGLTVDEIAALVGA